MSLRWKLFLLLGGLVALLLSAQGWMIRSLTDDLSQEVGDVAISVGRSVVSVFATGSDHVEVSSANADTEVVADRKVWVEAENADPVTVVHMKLCEDDGSGEEVCEEEVLRGAAAAAHMETLGTAATKGLDSSYSFKTFTHDLRREHGETGVDHEPLAVRLEQDADHRRFLLLEGPHLEQRIPVPQRPLDQRLERFSRRLVSGTLVIIGIGLLLAAVVAHRVTAPLRELAGAARQVGQGELGTQVREPTAAKAGGEVGEAIVAFNAMSSRLEALDEDARRLRARQHLSELGDVSRGLAHSLRNPLNALGLSLSRLAEPSDDAGGDPSEDPRRQDALEAAHRQIRRMDGAIRSFLALSSAGGVPEPVALAPLVRDVALEALQDGVGRVRVETELEALEAQARLAAVEPELRAVLQALVVNAVEASPGGETVTVRASPRDSPRESAAAPPEAPPESFFEIQVLDRGPGIPEDLRPRLFTPHTTTKPHGAGMGLYLARRIAEDRYGGSLTLEDRSGGGTLARLVVGPRQESVASAQKQEGSVG